MLSSWRRVYAAGCSQARTECDRARAPLARAPRESDARYERDRTCRRIHRCALLIDRCLCSPRVRLLRTCAPKLVLLRYECMELGKRQCFNEMLLGMIKEQEIAKDVDL